MKNKNKQVKFLKDLKNIMFNFKKISKNYKLQKIYNESDYANICGNFYFFSYNSGNYYLASGQSGYFNLQIESNGLGNMKFSEEDILDAKYIASFFGKELNISDGKIPITYFSTLGYGASYNYAEQTLPAFVCEDVFGLPPTHYFPINPLVFEKEEDYLYRVVIYQIKQLGKIDDSRLDEVLLRTKRLLKKFCENKSRLYLVNLNDVLNYKASFGDVTGLRGFKHTDDSFKIYENLDTLAELMESFRIDNNNFFSDPNMNSEYGIAIYGVIPPDKVQYIEVDSRFEKMQKKAIELGYSAGSEIPSYILEYSNLENKHLK